MIELPKKDTRSWSDNIAFGIGSLFSARLVQSSYLAVLHKASRFTAVASDESFPLCDIIRNTTLENPDNELGAG